MKLNKKNVVSFSIIFLLLAGCFFIFLRASFCPPVLVFDYFAQNKKELSEIDKKTLSSQLNFLRENNFRVVSLEEMARLIKEKKDLTKTVAITLDGGYGNNLEIAEILKTFDFPGTIFVTVNDINKEGYLGKEDLKYIAGIGSFNIGSRTLNNKNLTLLSKFELEKELFLSRRILENMLGVEVKSISYPGGAFNESVLRAVENSGYICGVGLDKGKANDAFSLRRVKITGKDTAKHLGRKLSGYYHILSLFKRK